LAPLVEAQLAKPTTTLAKAFAAEIDGARVLESSEGAWAEMAAALGSADEPAVGIDVEGNQTPGAPVLVQVACRTADGGGLVILEAPDRAVGLSAPLRGLLANAAVKKVVIDGPANADLTSLGLERGAAAEGGPLGGHIIDLEDVACALAGGTAVRRGVARLIEMGLPALGAKRRC
jgi:hypothetical protein